jgi:hypothetical protein
MSDISPKTIITRFDRDADQWSAWFELTPQVAFGGDLPVVAMRRLLEGTERCPTHTRWSVTATGLEAAFFTGI